MFQLTPLWLEIQQELLKKFSTFGIMIDCKICNSETASLFSTKILNKYNVEYFHCKTCGFVMTEEPYWLDEAYRYPINLTDTGIISRNIYSAKILSPLIFFLFGKSASGLDYAGGYGIFTRLMRDFGFNFYWHDPLTENIFARGFEISDQSVDLVTTFDSFEHFINPLKEIEDILKISDTVFFSTVLLPEKIPEPDEWWYYGFEHGQHISFYPIDTLKYIAKIFDMNLYSNGRWFHLLTKKKISNVIFNLLIAGSHLGLFTIVKKIMKSKIIDDMKYLISEKI